MSLLYRLGINKEKRAGVKNVPKVPLTFKQKQEQIKSQNRKDHRMKVDNEKNCVIIPTVARECPVCQNPMQVAVGQLAFSHRECRSRARRSTRRSLALA